MIPLTIRNPGQNRPQGQQYIERWKDKINDKDYEIHFYLNSKIKAQSTKQNQNPKFQIQNSFDLLTLILEFVLILDLIPSIFKLMLAVIVASIS